MRFANVQIRKMRLPLRTLLGELTALLKLPSWFKVADLRQEVRGEKMEKKKKGEEKKEQKKRKSINFHAHSGVDRRSQPQGA